MMIKMKRNKYLWVPMSMSIVLMVFLMLFLMSSITTVVFSNVNDSLTMNVSVGNVAPTVSGVVFDDNDGSGITITLTADGTTAVTCNGTITDTNGYEDVQVYGGANATFHHESSSAGATADKNINYENLTCTFTGGSGNTTTAVCGMKLEHEALNGTWTCTITARDNSSATGSDTDDNEVEQLLALTIAEVNISFGSMDPGDQTADVSARDINITNQGNVIIDVKATANAAMSCDGGGSNDIGAANISFASTKLGYDNGTHLSTTPFAFINLNTFNLGIEGMGAPFTEDQEATDLTYWGINIPIGVSGVCNNTIIVAAKIDE